MDTFTLTHKAKADLKSIAVYAQRKWGREQRLIYTKQFDDTFHMLAKAHDTGNKCDFIKAGYRKFPCASHIIFYKTKPGTEIETEIIRILHKRMDVRSQLGGI